MSALQGLRHRLRVLLAPRSYAREVDEEMRVHLELEAMQLRARGAGDDSAWAARRRFGNTTYQRDEVLRVSGIERLDQLRQDFSYALRLMRRSPGFAAAIIVMMALAFGVNAAVFSVLDPVLFRPPPGVAHPADVRRLHPNHPNSANAVGGQFIGGRFSYPEFASMRSALWPAAPVAAYIGRDSVALRIGADTAFANLMYVTPEYFAALGVRPSAGRLILGADDDLNAPAPVAVVSQRFAHQTLGADSSAVGRAIVVDDKTYTVVGVAGRDFEGMDWSASDVWVPFSTRPRVGERPGSPAWYASNDRYLELIARVDAPMSDRAFESRATLAYVRGYASHNKDEQGRNVRVGPIIEARGPGKVQQEVSISAALAVVSAILLLIACANTANLLLARAVLRRREIAVRIALGVSRARLASQLFVESTLLAVLAGAAAIIAAIWGGGALRFALLPQTRWVGGPVGIRVIAFTALITIAAALLSSILPAVLSSRSDLAEMLNGGARHGHVQRTRIRSTLLVFQAALSVALLAGATLFAKSFRNVQQIDLGIDGPRLITSSIRFTDRIAHPELNAEMPEAAERIATLPGVDGVAYGTGGPFLSWFSGVPLYAQGTDSALTKRRHEAEYNGVSLNYFQVTGTKIVSGRGFLPSDQAGSSPVMVVSKALAASLWPNASPLGQCLMPDARKNPCYAVVGVAEDAHTFRILEEQTLVFYVPVGQTPFPPTTLIVRTDGSDPELIAAGMRREASRTFPGATVQPHVVLAQLNRELRPWLLGAQLFSVLSLLALVVATVGVYSVVAFHARQRTHEMGVRIALGAQQSDLLRLIVGGGVKVLSTGIVLGVVCAVMSGKFLASLLYGVSPRDPGAMAVAGLILLTAGTMASVIPALRASRVNPAIILSDD